MVYPIKLGISAEKETLTKKPDSDLENDLLIAKHTQELKKADMNLILQLDQLVLDQQTALEKAGVPGFYSTTNPQEIRVQMYLLEFIIKLGKDTHQISTWCDF